MSLSNTNTSATNLTQRKRQLEEDLKVIERQIFDLEENYIEETNHYGNIIKGWDGYLNVKAKSLQNVSRRLKISNKNRIFSNSSTTSQWIFQMVDEENEHDNEEREEKRHRSSRHRSRANLSSDDDDDEY